MSLGFCLRAARLMRPCAPPRRCASRCATTASPGGPGVSPGRKPRGRADRRRQRGRRLDSLGCRQRCQAAKEGGRNRVHSFAENDIELMRRRREMQWAARSTPPWKEGRFELFRMPIQPVQKVETGAHYELLLRMRDEGGRMVSPMISSRRPSVTHHAGDRSLGDRKRVSLARLGGRRARKTFDVARFQSLPVRASATTSFLPFVIDQFQKELGLDASKICFRDHGDRGWWRVFSQANVSSRR